MKKIFAYVGSRHCESYTEQITKKLIEYVKNTLHEDLEVIVRTPNNSLIKECLGCNNCFTNGICPQIDDVSLIKKEIEESILVIFSSPVYLHNVSGSLKTFIDRISYWSHLFYLAGKYSVTISTSTSSGNQYIDEYNKKVLTLMGACNIANISIRQSELTDVALESILSTSAQKIANYIKQGDYFITSQQEMYFDSFKQLAQKGMLFTAEKEYYLRRKIVDYNNYYEYFSENFLKNNN